MLKVVNTTDDNGDALIATPIPPQDWRITSDFTDEQLDAWPLRKPRTRLRTLTTCHGRRGPA